MTQADSPDLPVTIIGGYLGAGKTTLVNNLLHQASRAAAGEALKLAVLVNDFGDIAIDAELIQGRTGQVLQLAGGCVCCTIGSDLMSALATLPEKVGRPDHVLIETSGVALPGTVAATAGLVSGMRRNGIVVLADGRALNRQRQDKYIADTIERQLAAADLLVLTKSDQLSEQQTSELLDSLRRDYPGARAFGASHGELPLQVALDAQPGMTNSNSLTKLRAPFNPASQTKNLFTSLSFTSDQDIDITALLNILGNRDLGIIRAKGFVQDTKGTRQLIQLVGEQIDISLATKTTGPSQLVIIGLAGQLQSDALGQALDKTGLTAH